MPAHTCVYRAPMRSPRDDVDLEATIDRAKALGLCGFGGAGSPDHRHDPEGLYWLGRIDGQYFYDADDAAVAVDLVHVRPTRWLPQPMTEPEVPAAVVATFGRGGRNFQQTHDPEVGAQTRQIWDARSG